MREYKCGLCNCVNEKKEWNEAFDNHYKDPGYILSVAAIAGDKNYFSVCPECGKEINGTNITAVEGE